MTKTSPDKKHSNSTSLLIDGLVVIGWLLIFVATPLIVLGASLRVFMWILGVDVCPG